MYCRFFFLSKTIALRHLFAKSPRHLGNKRNPKNTTQQSKPFRGQSISELCQLPGHSTETETSPTFFSLCCVERRICLQGDEPGRRCRLVTSSALRFTNTYTAHNSCDTLSLLRKEKLDEMEKNEIGQEEFLHKLPSGTYQINLWLLRLIVRFSPATIRTNRLFVAVDSRPKK